MSLLPNMSRSDDQDLLEARARRVCRLWANARVVILPIIDQAPKLGELDRAIFALGEVVFDGKES